jgi:hypothetical protein
MSDTTFTGFVVPSVSIENLVQQRDAVLERLKKALELIWEAEGIARKAHIGFPVLCHETNGGNRRSVYDKRYSRVHGDKDDEDENRYVIDKEAIVDRITRAVDADSWQYLMHESGLRTFMDHERREEWDTKIANDDVPPLCTSTIKATFESMFLNRGEMLEDGVIKCFKRLSWCYKTNQPFRFGPRIILRYMGEYNHRKAQELDDLVRVFHVLDGKPEPDHRQGMYRHIAESYRATKTWPKICETEYLYIKLFKNQNAHVLFKRSDVVDRMNEMLMRRFPGALPYNRHAE